MCSFIKLIYISITYIRCFYLWHGVRSTVYIAEVTSSSKASVLQMFQFLSGVWFRSRGANTKQQGDLLMSSVVSDVMNVMLVLTKAANIKKVHKLQQF